MQLSGQDIYPADLPGVSRKLVKIYCPLLREIQRITANNSRLSAKQRRSGGHEGVEVTSKLSNWRHSKIRPYRFREQSIKAQNGVLTQKRSSQIRAALLQKPTLGLFPVQSNDETIPRTNVVAELFEEQHPAVDTSGSSPSSLFIFPRLYGRSGIMCATSARLQKELANLNNACNKILRNLTVDNSNMRLWTGYIVPEEAPYSKGAFKIEITFPPEYPFKPPKLIFRTPIYHPNIDEKGMICLPIITPENWKPATKIEHVLQALISLLHSPEIEHPLRSDVAEEYVKDIKKFMKTAEEHTRKYAEKSSNL
ncbi:hypothetical protein PHET_04543 [Paragonimus heterotremus]|uniref:E2 ubiquitin-conjugating enzyme n=3 Tax=Paragonimus TaxID=34503 RepID=A0A8J4TLS4_9TREM|nr:hypothetical protein PHET_04543 [Paragonimus heterotremus]